MDGCQIQFHTSLNDDIAMKNYSARSLKLCGSYSGYRHLKKIQIVTKSQSINEFKWKGPCMLNVLTKLQLD